MASSSSLQPWKLMSLMLMIMVKSTVDAASYAHAVKSFQPSPWMPSHATFYDNESTQETMGGACGYGNLRTNGYGTNTAALSSVLFNNGNACGECFQIKCTQANHCYSGIVTVTATNLCPPNWEQDPDNGSWCNPPRTHFEMTKPAFRQIASEAAGIVSVIYRRVACVRAGGLRFSFQVNGYRVLVTVMNVGGAGDIASMAVKGTQTGWISMTHNWGASYQTSTLVLSGQALSFRVTSYTTKQTIIASNVAPSDWSAGATYTSTVNFH